MKFSIAGSPAQIAAVSVILSRPDIVEALTKVEDLGSGASLAFDVTNTSTAAMAATIPDVAEAPTGQTDADQTTEADAGSQEQEAAPPLTDTTTEPTATSEAAPSVPEAFVVSEEALGRFVRAGTERFRIAKELLLAGNVVTTGYIADKTGIDSNRVAAHMITLQERGLARRVGETAKRAFLYEGVRDTLLIVQPDDGAEAGAADEPASIEANAAPPPAAPVKSSALDKGKKAAQTTSARKSSGKGSLTAEIVKLLTESGPLDAETIAQRIGHEPKATDYLLQRLRKRRSVTAVNGASPRQRLWQVIVAETAKSKDQPTVSAPNGVRGEKRDRVIAFMARQGTDVSTQQVSEVLGDTHRPGNYLRRLRDFGYVEIAKQSNEGNTWKLTGKGIALAREIGAIAAEAPRRASRARA